MLKSGAPAPFPIPFANNAGAAYIRPIPQASQIGNVNGAASLTDGFPPLNFLAVNSGGIPPFGQDMNGILNAVTASLQYFQAGYAPSYSAAFSAEIGGYPAGATLLAATGSFFWVSTVDNNTSDPDTGGANWTGYYPFNPATSLAGYATTAQLAAASAAAAAQAAATPAGFRNMAIIGSTSNFVVPPGITAGKVTIVGAGGGSSGCSTATVNGNLFYAGACAGGGGWTISYVALTPGSSILAIIGAGGAGAIAGSPGGVGGTTSFGPFGSATGGTGGGVSGEPYAGGAPGAGSGGQFNGAGDCGSDGQSINTTGFWAGRSGGSLFGGSARSGVNGAIPGYIYGAGASAPCGAYIVSGAAGAPGVVIVEY